MQTVYLAAPLFTEAEREFNLKLKNELSNMGFAVYSPWEFCDGLYINQIFKTCHQTIHKCDIMLAVLDGSQVDDGTAWEIGYAYHIVIPIFGIRTDYRHGGETGLVNCMISNSCKKIYRSFEEFRTNFKTDL